MFEKTGIPSRSLVLEQFPTLDALAKPKAIIECYKEIPCNPCSTVCPFDAIFIPEDINVRPKIDFDACTGCGLCAQICPGLAITIRQLKGPIAILNVPYEMYPMPQQGQTVNVIDRSGAFLCEGLVTRVTVSKRSENTAYVRVEIPEAFLIDAMTLEVPHGS